MTSEHDVEIARIGAALQLLGSHDEELSAAARAYLLRQFSNSLKEPFVGECGEESTTNDNVMHQAYTLAQERCSKMRPGKTNMLADALRCSRALGHEGQCAFIE